MIHSDIKPQQSPDRPLGQRIDKLIYEKSCSLQMNTHIMTRQRFRGVGMLRISPLNVSSALFLLCIATTLGGAAQQHALESAANSNSSLNSSDALQKIYVD